MKQAPQVAAIHDLSGFGRCSMGIVLPVLSAMGNRCSTLLTAYLSAHTAYPPSERSVFLDLTDRMKPVWNHWAELGARFDAIYSGFLGSAEQIDLLRTFLERVRGRNTLVLVDPVMGYHGKPYATYTPEMCARMGSLAAQADLITPNLTEAAILLGEPYEAAPTGEAETETWLRRLSMDGRRSVVITGVCLSPGQVGAGCLDRTTGRISFAQAPEITGHFPGTGDLFSSVLLGELLRGRSLETASARAVSFVQSCAAYTLQLGTPLLDGVEFEPLLRQLME